MRTSALSIITFLNSSLSLAELKDSNKSLAEENGELRGYIDRLLLAVITHSPGVLEVQPSPEPSGLHSLTQ